MDRDQFERYLSCIIVALHLLDAQAGLRSGKWRLFHISALFAPLVFMDHIFLEAIECVRPMPLPLRVHGSSPFHLIPDHRLLCEEPLFALLAKRLAFYILSEFLFALESFPDLFLPIVIVVFKGHEEIRGSKLVYMWIIERSEGLPGRTQELKSDLVLKLSCLASLGIVFGHLFSIHLIQDRTYPF